MGAIEALQEVIHTVKAQFDFIYEKQTDKPTVSNLYWTNYRLAALWTISVLILICFKVYKRFQQYRRYQSSAFIIGLELTSDNDVCAIVTLRRSGGCMQHYHIHSPTFIQSIQYTLSLTGSTLDIIWPNVRVYDTKNNNELHINTTFSLNYIKSRRIQRILAAKYQAYPFISKKGLTAFIPLCSNNSDHFTPALQQPSDNIPVDSPHHVLPEH